MSGHTHTGTGFEELAHREGNGIVVELLWNRHGGSVVVTVVDTTTDSVFSIDVGDASPMDVFRHPYAYAAFRHVEVAARDQLSPASA